MLFFKSRVRFPAVPQILTNKINDYGYKNNER